MPSHWSDIPDSVMEILRAGSVIPAHPLALNAQRKLDPVRQRSLSRYYLDAGCGGLAVGVHGTQFAIRESNLYEPVLKTAAQTVNEWTDRPVLMIAGLAGKTEQAIAEASIANANGYHAGMLAMSAMAGASVDELIAHCEAVAKEIPLVGFYLQAAVGGIPLPESFWTRFAQIDNVIAIKLAPFDRYKTLDAVRGVVAARAEHKVTLYTGNDDHIVPDLLTPYTVMRDDDTVNIRFRGGLLGHWSVWSGAAVRLLNQIHQAIESNRIDTELLALDSRVTDCNAAVFDVANNFAGVIPGCHEVLRRQGLLEGTWCLDPNEQLSPGQAELISRVSSDHPMLTDDQFVKQNLERWLN